MVTRTVTVTKYRAMCVDTNIEQIIIKQGEIAGDYTSKPELLKRLKTLYESEEIKYVNILTAQTTTQKRGMPEQEFFEKSVNLEKEN